MVKDVYGVWCNWSNKCIFIGGQFLHHAAGLTNYRLQSLVICVFSFSNYVLKQSNGYLGFSLSFGLMSNLLLLSSSSVISWIVVSSFLLASWAIWWIWWEVDRGTGFGLLGTLWGMWGVGIENWEEGSGAWNNIVWYVWFALNLTDYYHFGSVTH